MFRELGRLKLDWQRVRSWESVCLPHCPKKVFPGLTHPTPTTTDLPINEYFEYFGPTYKLDVPQSNMDDLNTREYLEKIKAQVFENLRHTGIAPSVQLQRECSHSSSQSVERCVC